MFLIDCLGIQCNVRFSVTCAMLFQALQAYHLCQGVPVLFYFNSLWLLVLQTMANMNKALKLPQIQKIMMEFEKQV